MKTTVIIPVYNRQDLIALALRSLLRQRHAADLDLLVVDDGSQDDTVATIRRQMADNPCIRLIECAHRGISATRNTGLANLLPETELVSFLDSDDISPPDRLAPDIAEFRRQPDLDLIYSKLQLTKLIDARTLEPAPYEWDPVRRTFQMACAVYRRSFLERVGTFDEHLVQAEDTDFLFRSFELEPSYQLSDRIGVYYRLHEGGVSRDVKLNQRYFVKALGKSIARRRGNPDRGSIQSMFEPRVEAPERSANGN